MTPSLISLPAPAVANAWQLDPVHSAATFSVKHLMVATVRGTMSLRAGRLVLDPARPQEARVEAELDPATIATGIADRDAHLRSEQFFDVANFPALTFRSTRVVLHGEGRADVHGELTMRGVTRPVAIAASYGGEAKDPWGGRRLAFTGETTLDRTDFGLGWNEVLETGGVLVSDKVKVVLDLEFIAGA